MRSSFWRECYMVVYGAGEWGVKAAEFYGISRIKFFVDNDPQKAGTYILGIEIISFSTYLIKKDPDENVIIANYKHREQIAEELEALGINYLYFSPQIVKEIDGIKEYVRLRNSSGRICLFGSVPNLNIVKEKIEIDTDFCEKKDSIIRVSNSLNEDQKKILLNADTIFVCDPVTHASDYLLCKDASKHDAEVIDIYARKLYSENEKVVVDPYLHRSPFLDEKDFIEDNDSTRMAWEKEINLCTSIMLRTRPLFNHVQIETINKCNNTCKFCPANRKADNRPLIKMDYNLFKKIVFELEEIQFNGDISLFVNNEPFLDDRIIEMNRYMRRKLPNARIYLVTNGTLLDLNKFESLMESIDELIIDNYTGNHSLTQQAKSIIEHISHKKDLERRVTVFIRDPNECLTSRGGDSPNRISVKDYGAVSCVAPFQELNISPNGDILLCCNDVYGKYKIGNMRNERLVDIWFGKTYERIRNEMSKGRSKLESCKKCDTFLWHWSIMNVHKYIYNSKLI